MKEIIIPEHYQSALDLHETQVAIKTVKDFFQNLLAERLNLLRVSAPLFVLPSSGLNDNLNGVERPVSFDILEDGRIAEVVHSLAKWKRYALQKYGFRDGEGLYTDMSAIRRDEDTDNIHSIYVDQWDWEKVINRSDRNMDYLVDTARAIYMVMRSTELHFATRCQFDSLILPDEITVISSQEMEDAYPELTPARREYVCVKKYGAIFVTGIGGKLRSGGIHDGRAPDYDDWSLNGDIIVYNPVLDISFELSSMGIRVDAAAMRSQLEERGAAARASLPFHQAVLNDELPLTVGGGIGQSRLCMFFLRKAHIGEVQSSLWSEETRKEAAAKGVHLL